MTRIAIVQAPDGHLTCVGPNGFDKTEYPDQMTTALVWHQEAGHLPAAQYWITVDLPPVPTIPELRGLAEKGEFPKSLIDEMDGLA